MVSLKKQGTKSIFRDERDLAVAVKYMKQNGKEFEINFIAVGNSENMLFNNFTPFQALLCILIILV